MPPRLNASAREARTRELARQKFAGLRPPPDHDRLRAAVLPATEATPTAEHEQDWPARLPDLEEKNQPGKAAILPGGDPRPGLVHLAWDFSLTAGRKLIDALLPGFPTAGAQSIASRAETCASAGCADSRHSRLGEKRPSVASLETQGQGHFHFHLSASRQRENRRQALSASVLIFALESDTDSLPHWQALFEAALRKGDLLFRERACDWLENSPGPNPPAGIAWTEAGMAIDATNFRQLRKQARRKMAPVLKAIRAAFPESAADSAAFWDQTYERQLEFIKQQCMNIQVSPQTLLPNEFDLTGYAEKYLDFVRANALFDQEQERMLEQRCNQIMNSALRTPGSTSTNKLIVMDAALVRRIGSAILGQLDAVIVTDKRWPINLGWSGTNKHPTMIRYLKELVEARNGRALISPKLANRADQSLAGTLVLLADEEHDNLALLWQGMELAHALLTPGDKIVVELGDDQKPGFFDCLGNPDNCIAIDDADSRNALLPYVEKCRQAQISVNEQLRAEGRQAIPGREKVEKFNLFQLARMAAGLMPLRTDPHTSPASRQKLDLLARTWTAYHDKTDEVDPVREAVMLSRMKDHVFAQGACFGSVGALHVAKLERQILSELPAIIIWPDFPGTEFAKKKA